MNQKEGRWKLSQNETATAQHDDRKNVNKSNVARFVAFWIMGDYSLLYQALCVYIHICATTSFNSIWYLIDYASHSCFFKSRFIWKNNEQTTPLRYPSAMCRETHVSVH